MKRPRTVGGWIVLILVVPLVLCFAIALLETIGENLGALPTRTPRATQTLTPIQTPRPTDTPRPPTATPTVAVYIAAGGDGVYLRSKPDMNAKLTVYPDGSAMTVIERSPAGWVHVTAPDGVVGYVPSEYITDNAPPTATRTPTKMPTPVPTQTPRPTATAPTPKLEVIEQHAESGQSVWYAAGTVRNNTNRTYAYVQVAINLYDASGALIGSTWDNVNNLEPGGLWKFRAAVFETGVAGWRVMDVTGF